MPYFEQGEPEPAPVGADYVRRLLVLSSCFRDDWVKNEGTHVCTSSPCACAQSLLDEISKPLWLKIERLRVALRKIVDEDDEMHQSYGLKDIARKALEE